MIKINLVSRIRKVLRFRLLGPVLRKNDRKIVPYSELIFSKKDLTRAEYFFDFSEKVCDVPGVFIECGFGLGNSFMVITYFGLKQNRKIYGFDSFQGFPPLSQNDIGSMSSEKSKSGAWNHTSFEEAENKIATFGYAPMYKSNIFLEPGFVEVSIPRFLEQNLDLTVALLHLDLDLYEGYKVALHAFWPKISIGGLVLLDEYDDPKWPGAKTAVDEFSKQMGVSVQSHPSGKHFLKKTK